MQVVTTSEASNLENSHHIERNGYRIFRLGVALVRCLLKENLLSVFQISLQCIEGSSTGVTDEHTIDTPSPNPVSNKPSPCRSDHL